MITRVPEVTCLNCHHRLDSTGYIRDETKRPKPGDYTVCVYCGHLMVFADDITLRQPTSAELVEAAGNEELLEAIEFAKAFRDCKTSREDK